MKTSIRKKLWNWCPRPKKPVSLNFTRLTIPLYVSILIGGLLLTAGVAVFLLPPPGFFSNLDESGRATEVVERLMFPGGAIVVYKYPVDLPRPTWYIRIKIHNYITCEDDLSAYVNSRTTALNELLYSLNPDDKIWITVTFKEPVEPADFRNFYENHLAASERLDRSAIIVENEASEELQTIILNAPAPDYLEEFVTYPKEGLKMTGVISFDALTEVNVARILTQDSRILLIDPQECLTLRGLVEKYGLKGFNVTVDRPPILVRVFESELTYGVATTHGLLANPSKYDRSRLYITGKVSALGLLEDPFFKLNEDLLVCYKYDGIDLYEQIASQDINNGDYVILVGTFFLERAMLYVDTIEKVKQDYQLTLTVDELLDNAAQYDGQTLQVFGRASDLGNLEGPLFRLDGKIFVCYAYDNVDLYSYISKVRNGDPIIVIGFFHYDNVTLYARHIRASK